MSIAPIDYSAFQRNPVGIEAVLARGGSALSSILRDAMQVGRDRANRQAAQEKDFLSERSRIENLNQRRGEVALQAEQQDRQFDEGVRQFNDRMSADESRFEVTSELQKDQYDLQNAAAERDKMRLADEIKANEFERTTLNPLKVQTEQGRIAAEGEKAKAEQAQAALYQRGADEQARKNADVVKGTELLQSYNEALAKGDTAAAQGFARSLLDPRFELDATSKEIIITQSGLPLPKKSSSSAKEPEVKIGDLTDDELEAELRVIGATPVQTSSGFLTEKTALRKAALEEEQKNRKEKGVYKPAASGSVDSAATIDLLKKRGQGQ